MIIEYKGDVRECYRRHHKSTMIGAEEYKDEQGRLFYVCVKQDSVASTFVPLELYDDWRIIMENKEDVTEVVKKLKAKEKVVSSLEYSLGDVEVL